MVVYEGIAANNAHPYLGAELHFRLCLAPYHRADMRLEDADDAVVAGVDTDLEHPFLLVVHPHDCKEQRAVASFQGVKGRHVCPAEKIKGGAYVAV